MLRPPRHPVLVIAVLCALSACIQTTTGGVPGSLTLQRPGALPAVARPPAPAAPVTASPREGAYAGEGRLVFNPGLRGACRETIPVTGFVVAGSFVVFNGSRAAIGPDGSLTLQAGRRWLSGHFVGAGFEGRLWQPPPACTYAVALAPVG